MNTVAVSSEVDASLDRAYKAADYVLPSGRGACRFRIGECSPLCLDDWLSDVGSAAWLTAFNPQSRPLSLLDNLRHHQLLWQWLRQRGYTAVAGYASDPLGVWPDEVSLLIPGMEFQVAQDLAESLQQNAFLWLIKGEPVQLIWVNSQE